MPSATFLTLSALVACHTVCVNKSAKSHMDAAKTALIPLRPLSIGEVLDSAFVVMRRSARSYLGLPVIAATVIVAVVSLVVAVELILRDLNSPALVLLVIVGSVLVATVVIGAVMVWFTSMLTRTSLVTVMGEGYVSTSRLSFAQSLRWIGPSLALALLTFCALGLAGSVSGVINMVLSVFLVAGAAMADTTLLALFTIVTSLIGLLSYGWAWSWFSLAVPIYVSEGPHAPNWVGRGPRPVNVIIAFARSARLVGWKNSLRVGIIYLIAGVLFILAYFFSFAGSIILMYLYFQSLMWTVDISILIIVSALASAFVPLVLAISYIPALQTMVYLDLRMRREGLDLSLRFDAIPISYPGRVG